MFLDIGIGILTSIFVSHFFNIEISIWIVIFSISFALLPDLDFLYFYPKKHDTKYDYKHRDIIHYPLLYLPIGTLIFWIIFGKVWGIAFFIASLFHFIHDSIGIGWGIKWLYPFSRDNHSFFYLYAKDGQRGWRKLIFIFKEKELPGIVAKYGDPNWVKNIYFKWHPIAIFELAFFILSLIILLIYVK